MHKLDISANTGDREVEIGLFDCRNYGELICVRLAEAAKVFATQDDVFDRAALYDQL